MTPNECSRYVIVIQCKPCIFREGFLPFLKIIRYGSLTLPWQLQMFILHGHYISWFLFHETKLKNDVKRYTSKRSKLYYWNLNSSTFIDKQDCIKLNRPFFLFYHHSLFYGGKRAVTLSPVRETLTNSFRS